MKAEFIKRYVHSPDAMAYSFTTMLGAGESLLSLTAHL